MFFVEREAHTVSGERTAVELCSMDGEPVDAVYFKSQRSLVQERDLLHEQGRRPLEADVKPSDRFLMERFVTGALQLNGPWTQRDGYRHYDNPQVRGGDFLPELRVLSFDVESEGLDGALLSIAGICGKQRRVFMVGKGPEAPGLQYGADEAAVLGAFVDWVQREDPDVLAGWNVVEFDLRYLAERARRAGVPLTLGRGGQGAKVLAPRSRSQPYVARVPGRVVLDGIATLRSATYSFESFALEDVAQQLLGRGKAIDQPQDRVAEIKRLHREDPLALARYNLQDCQLVLDIFDATDLLGFAVQRQQLTGLPMDRQGGSVAAFDNLYLPRLHREGVVAPSIGALGGADRSPGGYVLNSSPGLYRNVLVLDFKSLYPSIIRTFKIDPLGLAVAGDDAVQGFEGARFHRQRHVLPELIATLWSARDDAKARKDAARSQAIKILMNSFYGVLGSPGCRFFSPRLASSITLRGHQIITDTQQQLQDQGFRVIYGDTDSLFVLMGEDADEQQCGETGRRLAQQLNAYWQQRVVAEHGVDSALEVEFETHYLRFLMPTMRGSDKGTKKRYAGSVRRPDGSVDIVFKGLEVVRTDWTPLARAFQRELFRRVFEDEPYEQYVVDTATALRRGQLDDQLVYRKRLRRDLDDYTRNVPPHVQAARQLDGPARHVEYYITVAGPQPVQKRTAALDYHHYIERQLAPAADTILAFVGRDFSSIAGLQLSLF